MDKYIKVEDLEKFIGSDTSGIFTDAALNMLISAKAKPMVSVEDIERIIMEHANLHSSSKYCVFGELQDLMNPQPKKYGGFTIPEWEQLSKLPYINIELHSDMGARTHYFLDEFMDTCGDLEEIKELLPDPDNHIRHHNGTGVNPLPENVLIKTYFHHDSGSSEGQSCEYDWNDVFGYRIIGVKGQ